MIHTADNNTRPAFDQELVDMANYVSHVVIDSPDAYATARLCLMDALGCGFLAQRYPECTKHLGPLMKGTVVPHGARVPGTQYVLDPVQAAFNIGTLNRWLDYNDTWLAAEWGHPSDNLAAILAVADTLSQQRRQHGAAPLLMRDVLTALIKSYEIQGILALQNSFNRVGLDHVLLVKVASTAVVTALLGGNQQQILNALSLAWVDGQSLRTYRHAPNTGSRKSWAAGDAASRAVRLAYMALQGEPGYPSALSAPIWGFYAVSFNKQALCIEQPYRSYVMENILFKIAFPAEFHSQTALECALILHPQVAHRLNEISKIVITTHESALRIISKTGPLHNPADRDHCLQYIVAIGLLFGNLTADHYEDHSAADPRIDTLRNIMEVVEDPRFSREYHAADKRSIANAIQVHFTDGSATDNVCIEYPLGHRRRRAEGIPLLEEKFAYHVASRFPKQQAEQIIKTCTDHATLEQLPVDTFMEMLVI